MITCVRAPCRFGVVGPVRQWQMQPPAVSARGVRTVRGAQLPWIYKLKEGEGESLTSTLSIRRFLLIAFVSRFLAPLLSPTGRFIFARHRQLQWPRPRQSWCWTRCRGAVRR
jgi:hypothetical protein